MKSRYSGPYDPCSSVVAKQHCSSEAGYVANLGSMCHQPFAAVVGLADYKMLLLNSI